MSALRRYILDADGQPVAEHDLALWVKWFTTAQRRIGLEQVGEVEVSTVFIGCDHRFVSEGGPILWETMTFGPGPWDGWCWRYTSREDAVRGHVRVVDLVRAGAEPPDEPLGGAS
jgi:hypothetical protein